ncbi:MAG: 2-oxoacid:acceptor oxidoreductase family protein, partial [Elusimicrobiales bacterium]|nr:2-oxoacid:acceptor oxidoreductase family protein [Elusimicrobiales bacterium]
MSDSSPKKNVKISELNSITVRFAGDSGDGIQLVGNQFATATAKAGNDLSTLPDYPAEIRSPAGSISGVSGFQISFGDDSVLTPGNRPDVLVVMNQPSLDAFEKDVVDGGLIVVDTSIVEGRPDAERLDALMIPATNMADEVGTPKVANVVIMGALAAKTGAFSLEMV